MAGRYELSAAQWQRISDLLPGKAGDPGRTGADNRLFVNAVLWVLRSGARWEDLPERYGKYKSVHKRFTRWIQSGVWERLLIRSPPTRTTNTSCSIPRSFASTSRPPAEKGGPDQAVGRSRGGLTTKIHTLTDARGRPLRFILTAGEAHDSTTAADLLADRNTTGVIADKAYDNNALRELIGNSQAEAIIPSLGFRKGQIPHDRIAYKLRNRWLAN